MMGFGWGAGFGGGIWMIGGLLLMIGVVVLVVWAVNAMSHGSQVPSPEHPRPTPNEILRERFARGEISEQEFEQAKKALGPDR